MQPKQAMFHYSTHNNLKKTVCTPAVILLDTGYQFMWVKWREHSFCAYISFLNLAPVLLNMPESMLSD